MAALLLLVSARLAAAAEPAAPSPTESCSTDWNSPPSVVRENPKRRYFSIDGYVERKLAVEFQGKSGVERHCLRVAWPAGLRNADGRPSKVAARINGAWLRALANTLGRVPPAHARLLQRVVIDNRPREHGIAAHDRARHDDARDGRTLWLHEHVFLEPNHWARGNYGAYWSYHANQDGVTIDRAGAEHQLFSPVVLHELGHLVMYHLVNGRFTGPAATSAPPCAELTSKTASVNAPTPAELEAGCVSPYCRSFQFNARTENWAEQYRFYYQSSAAREALGRSRAACMALLNELEPPPRAAPWERGLPDGGSLKKSRWQSCNGRACKAW